ncbi:MAG TPA: tRNA epoxyqueuosine(34) reductase QueG [Fimbriimonadaceae bacterium]|nr:tRNA epoxyqueuosine(34) reductase QueG [Fimbriimonadaceae bacterium]
MKTLIEVPADSVKAEALKLGFDLVGVCRAQEPPHLAAYEDWIEKGRHASMDYLRRHLPLKRHPDALLPGVKTIIAVGLNYNQPRPQNPKIARYALGRDYHKVLRGKLYKLSARLEQNHPEARFRACVDSAPVMERDFAQLAGLGWFGKNTMLINSARGSWFFLGLLLTTVPFETDLPASGSCGTCTRCVDACPTGAIIFDDGRWQIDARRCISYQTIEHSGALEVDAQGWVFGCDVCQEVCPFNQARANQPLRAAPTPEPEFRATRAWPPPEVLARLSYDEWDQLTRGSAIRRAGHEGLRRNAAQALAQEPVQR